MSYGHVLDRVLPEGTQWQVGYAPDGTAPVSVFRPMDPKQIENLHFQFDDERTLGTRLRLFVDGAEYVLDRPVARITLAAHNEIRARVADALDRFAYGMKWSVLSDDDTVTIRFDEEIEYPLSRDILKYIPPAMSPEMTLRVFEFDEEVMTRTPSSVANHERQIQAMKMLARSGGIPQTSIGETSVVIPPEKVVHAYTGLGPDQLVNEKPIGYMELAREPVKQRPASARAAWDRPAALPSGMVGWEPLR